MRTRRRRQRAAPLATSRSGLRAATLHTLAVDGVRLPYEEGVCLDRLVALVEVAPMNFLRHRFLFLGTRARRLPETSSTHACDGVLRGALDRPVSLSHLRRILHRTGVRSRPVRRWVVETATRDAACSLGSVSTERLEADVCTMAGQLAAAMCSFLLRVGELDRREAWKSWECRSMAHWLSWKCGSRAACGTRPGTRRWRTRGVTGDHRCVRRGHDLVLEGAGTGARRDAGERRRARRARALRDCRAHRTDRRRL